MKNLTKIDGSKNFDALFGGNRSGYFSMDKFQIYFANWRLKEFLGSWRNCCIFNGKQSILCLSKKPQIQCHKRKMYAENVTKVSTFCHNGCGWVFGNFNNALSLNDSDKKVPNIKRLMPKMVWNTVYAFKKYWTSVESRNTNYLPWTFCDYYGPSVA